MSSELLFASTERGWIAHRYINKLGNLQKLRDNRVKVLLVLIEKDISKYKNIKRMGKGKLDEISAVLGKCREHGLKVILLLVYGWTKKRLQT